MRDPTKKEVVGSILRGIREAQEDYKEAYESHINSEFAPEYLMTTYIFKSILELKKKRCGCGYGISLEEPVKNLIRKLREVGGLETRGNYSNQGRVYGDCDLLLRSINNDRPIAVIEVKKDPRNYWEDIARLSYLVNKNGLEFGVFASYWTEEVKDNPSDGADERIKTKMDKILLQIKEDIAEVGYDLSVERELSPINSLQLIEENPNRKE